MTEISAFILVIIVLSSVVFSISLSVLFAVYVFEQFESYIKNKKDKM